MCRVHDILVAMTNKEMQHARVVYAHLKAEFDKDPLVPVDFGAGEAWDLYHLIKIRLIERRDSDLWCVKNQFEFAMMLALYRIPYLEHMNIHSFPLLIEFFDHKSFTTDNRLFDFRVISGGV